MTPLWRGFNSFRELPRRQMLPDGPTWPFAAGLHLVAALLATLFHEREIAPSVVSDCGLVLTAIEDLAEEVRSLRALVQGGPPGGGDPTGASEATEPGHSQGPVEAVGAFEGARTLALGAVLGLLLGAVVVLAVWWRLRRTPVKEERRRLRGPPRRHGGGRLE